MAQFPVNSTRLDPYKSFKFRVKWRSQPGGPLQYVAGISKVSGLKAPRWRRLQQQQEIAGA